MDECLTQFRKNAHYGIFSFLISVVNVRPVIFLKPGFMMKKVKTRSPDREICFFFIKIV
jgi:hypothetical protein